MKGTDFAQVSSFDDLDFILGFKNNRPCVSSVNGLIASLNDTFLLLSGGTMTGDLTFSGSANIVGPGGTLIDFTAVGGFEATADNGVYAEGWYGISSTYAYLGFNDDFIRFQNDSAIIYINNNEYLSLSPFQTIFGNAAASMQFRTLLSYAFTDIPNYANDAAADADAGLESKAIYTTTAGGRTVFVKP